MTVVASAGRGTKLCRSATTAHSSAIAPRVFADLLRGQRIAEVAIFASATMPDRLELTLDDARTLIVAAQALPANGRPVEAALTAEIASSPLHADAIDPLALGEVLSRRVVRSVTLTGHPGTTNAYHLLIALDRGDQIAIQAHALPAEAGSPVLGFARRGGDDALEAIGLFDDAGELTG